MGKTQTKKGAQAKTKGSKRPRKGNAKAALGAVEADTSAVVRLTGTRISLTGLLGQPKPELFQPLPGFTGMVYKGGQVAAAILNFDTAENAAKSCDMLVVNHPVELDDYLPLDNTEWRTPDMDRLSKLAVKVEE